LLSSKNANTAIKLIKNNPNANDNHQGLNTHSQLISVKPITFNTINIMTKTVVQDTPTPTILSVLFIILLLVYDLLDLDTHQRFPQFYLERIAQDPLDES